MMIQILIPVMGLQVPVVILVALVASLVAQIVLNPVVNLAVPKHPIPKGSEKGGGSRR